MDETTELEVQEEGVELKGIFDKIVEAVKAILVVLLPYIGLGYFTKYLK